MTAAALYTFLKQAYEHYSKENVETEQVKNFQEWRSESGRLIPQFKFWDITLNLVILMLRFVRSIRCGEFWMYVDSIRKLLPWFFALDHVNYARWMAIHIKDLVNLKHSHPELLSHFEDGKFVARKTDRMFSGMALDQAHEQMNALLKGDGGT